MTRPRTPQRRLHRTLTLALAGALTLAGAGCRTAADPTPPLFLEARALESAAIPVLGTDSTLDVGTWNLEWFGDGGNGPADDALQLENVHRVLHGLAMDLWSVQEVTNAAQFETLLASLDGYDGFLANDPMVVDGPDYYNGFGGNEMKVGLVYRSATTSIAGARVILTDHDHAFAGRPPLEVRLTVRDERGEGAGGPSGSVDLVVVLLHAKAGADAEDRDRRAAGARALKDYLDATHPAERVLVIGDFNDDVDVSITRGQPSPYAPFVADTADYLFPTGALSTAGIASTVFYPDVIDHHLVSDELRADLVPGAVASFPADDHLDRYGETTSDHYPVLVRYAPWSAGGPDLDAGVARARVELGWSGARSDSVDIFRDGALVGTTGNDGAHVDEVAAARGATFAYRVCEADTDHCSSVVTVTF